MEIQTYEKADPEWLPNGTVSQESFVRPTFLPTPSGYETPVNISLPDHQGISFADPRGSSRPPRSWVYFERQSKTLNRETWAFPLLDRRVHMSQ